ncbi:MAG: hypothetical protein AB1545_09690 [Thermodesulfobacteriota bacterium]
MLLNNGIFAGKFARQYCEKNTEKLFPNQHAVPQFVSPQKKEKPGCLHQAVRLVVKISMSFIPTTQVWVFSLDYPDRFLLQD